MTAPRQPGPGYTLAKVRDAAGRWLWRAVVWSGRAGDGQFTTIEQRGGRAQVLAATEQQMKRFNQQQRGAAA